MRKFLRLLRYGLPYTLEWLPGVALSVRLLVGILERVSSPPAATNLDQVLTPNAPEGPILLGLGE